MKGSAASLLLTLLVCLVARFATAQQDAVWGQVGRDGQHTYNVPDIGNGSRTPIWGLPYAKSAAPATLPLYTSASLSTPQPVTSLNGGMKSPANTSLRLTKTIFC